MAVEPGRDALIRRRVLIGAASQYAGKLATIATWILLTPFILSRLGQTEYGLWVLVGSVVAYGTLLDFGLTNAVVKHVAECRAVGDSLGARAVVATALRLYCGLGLLAVLLALALAPLFPLIFDVPLDERSTASWLVLLMGASIGLAIPGMATQSVLQGLQRYDLLNLINTAVALSSALATVVVLSLGGGVLGMVALNLPMLALAQIATLACIRRVAPELGFGWRGANLPLARRLAGFSTTLFVLDLAAQVELKTDEIVVGASLPIRLVTPYALAHKLADAAQLVTDQVVELLLPLAAELHAVDDRVRLRALYLTATRLTLAIFLPVGGTIIVLAGPILAAWVGEEYAEYAPLVLVLGLAGLLASSQRPAGAILQGIGRHRPLAAMAIGSAAANLAISIALVRPLGLLGVALGTCIPTAVISLGWMLPYALRTIGISFHDLTRQVLLPALLPAIPMTLTLLVVRAILPPLPLLALAPIAGLGPIIYLVLYLSFGASSAERETVRRLSRTFALSIRSAMPRRGS